MTARPASGGPVAVVTVAHGRHDHLAAQHRSLAHGQRRPDRYLVVAMDDPAIRPARVRGLASSVIRVGPDERGLPLAAARNAGVRVARLLGAEVVVLLDVDCLAGADLVDGYATAVAADPRTLWLGPVTYLAAEDRPYRLRRLDDLDAPHPARPAPGPGEVEADVDPALLWSLSLAVHVDTWDRLGGFHEGYAGYGCEDTDLGMRAAQAQVPLAMTGSARAYHQHHPVSDPPVEHAADLVRNARLFRERWGRWPAEGWLQALAERGLVEWDAQGDASALRLSRSGAQPVSDAVPEGDQP